MNVLKESVTIFVPVALLQAADALVAAGEAASREELIALALEREMAARERAIAAAAERAAIDADFAEMANDPEYQAEALMLAEASMADGWTALRSYEEDE